MNYPYYLHNDGEFVKYWEKYFKENPPTDDTKISIYIDFPFCRSICKFCVFGSYKIDDYKEQIRNYENAVVNLVSQMKDVLPKRINCIYFGGGTPSLWNRDSLKRLTEEIPMYNDANLRMFEAHPYDLDSKLVDFLINDINIKTVSFGIQSFDIESNRSQHRLPVDIYKLKDAIDKFHENGMYVNIDIVALFNDDNELGWEIFLRDMDIAMSLHPDDICSVVNFKRPNYYGKSLYYRKLMREFVSKHPNYVMEHSNSLSLDINDIIAYEEEPYHFRTLEYDKFYRDCRVAIMDRKPEVIKNNVTIAFGGNEIHNGISRAGANMEQIASRFDFNRQRFIHEVYGIKTSNKNKNIIIGNQVIDPEFDASYDVNLTRY